MASSEPIVRTPKRVKNRRKDGYRDDARALNTKPLPFSARAFPFPPATQPNALRQRAGPRAAVAHVIVHHRPVDRRNDVQTRAEEDGRMQSGRAVQLRQWYVVDRHIEQICAVVEQVDVGAGCLCAGCRLAGSAPIVYGEWRVQDAARIYVF